LRRARARVRALGCICLRVQSALRTHRCAYHAHVGACPCMRGDFAWLRPRSSPRLPLVARRARPHARAVRGRSIYATKVKALPESLGQCKLLEFLCVRARRRRAPPPCALAAVPALRCCAWRCRDGELGDTTRRWMRRRRRRRSSAGGRARARVAGARGRPARVHGGPEPPGAAARLARRRADNTELAALPAAVEWPKLKTL
jgi:hypothetical protein